MSSIELNANEFTKVGVVGIGTMGHFMVDKLIENQFSVVAFDIAPKAKEYARSKGAEIADTPAELAEKCNFIVMSLPGSPQIHEVLFGEDGIHKTVNPRTIVVDTSTVDPITTQKAAAGLEPLGVDYLDCPILGRPSKIGFWLLPTGGKADVLERAKPVLSTFASTIVHVGESGAGNAVKLLNQMMFTVINAISTEVMAIADYCGITKEIFYQTVASSSAATVSGLFKEVGNIILNDSFEDPTFTVELLVKDSKLALQMAKDAGSPSVIAGTVQLYNEIAVANGFGKEDSSALYKTFKKHFGELQSVDEE